MENTYKKIEQQVPELAFVGSTAGAPSSTEVWNGEEHATAGYVLIDERERDTRKLALQKTPNIGLKISTHRYLSAAAAKKDLENGLRSRPAMEPVKEAYRGAALYRYTSGSGEVICQYNQYIIEISPRPRSGITQALVMKVLNVALTELTSTNSNTN